MKELEKKLSQWDGKSVEDLEELYHSIKQQKNYSPADSQQQLIQLLENANLQTGASWLLKHGWEQQEFVPTATDSKNILHSLPQLSAWEAKLHILQSLTYLALDQASINKTECKRLYAFLQKNLSSDNKFVRAWTYNGLYELTLNYPSYTEEVKQLFRRAMKDEAASVKARIRNIVKSGFTLDS